MEPPKVLPFGATKVAAHCATNCSHPKEPPKLSHKVLYYGAIQGATYSLTLWSQPLYHTWESGLFLPIQKTPVLTTSWPSRATNMYGRVRNVLGCVTLLPTILFFPYRQQTKHVSYAMRWPVMIRMW